MKRVLLFALLFCFAGCGENDAPTAAGSENARPVADAGSDLSGETGETLTLSGSGLDVDGDALTYQWIEDAANPMDSVLSDATLPSPAFTAMVRGVYRFALIVNDGSVDSLPDTVEIAVKKSFSGLAELPDGVTMEFVWIEPGTFTMGTTGEQLQVMRDSSLLMDSYLEEEKPPHEVTISRGFYLGKFEVTQAQWEAVMGSNPSSFKGADRPVERVSWNDVQGFIDALNAAEGEEIYRLPTEAEWEYACRAGTTTLWSHGNDERELRKHAWYRDNNNSMAKRVGMKLPNPWGLYDMHGNVQEWCLDWGSWNYPDGARIDPTGPTTGGGHGRVIRGGDFSEISVRIRSAMRSSCMPNNRLRHVGFRLLRMEQAPPPADPQDGEQIRDD